MRILQELLYFQLKPLHDENYLEFIAKDKLRDKLNLKDGG